MDTIELLCGVLEVTPTYLMGSKSDDDYATIIGKLMSEPDILDFIEEYKALDKEDKKAIKQIVSSLNKILLDRMVLIYRIRMNYLHIFMIIVGNYLLWGVYKTKYLIDQQEKYKALKTFIFHLNHSISL